MDKPFLIVRGCVMRRVSEAPDFWVPEDYVYKTASECLLTHPDQAAAGVLHMDWQAKYDRAIVALKEIMDNHVGYAFEICDDTSYIYND